MHDYIEVWVTILKKNKARAALMLDINVAQFMPVASNNIYHVTAFHLDEYNKGLNFHIFLSKIFFEFSIKR